MVQCLCPSTQHTDPAGCIIVHDGELGEACQICFKHHQADIQGLNLIACRHRKIKEEVSESESNWYCRIHKGYLTPAEVIIALLDQVPTLRVETANTWKPDTADTRVEFAYDHDDSAGPKVYSRTFKASPDHPSLNGQVFLDVLFDENGRKNQQEGDMLADDLFGEDVTERGETRRQFKAGITHDWFFTGQNSVRILHSKMNGVTVPPGKIVSMQATANGKFGLNKVIIE